MGFFYTLHRILLYTRRRPSYYYDYWSYKLNTRSHELLGLQILDNAV